MGLLEDKVIVITGGSLGIGFAVAKKCATEGATVVIAADDKTDLGNALNSLQSLSDKDHKTHLFDVSQYDQVQDFVQWIAKEYSKIHGLVNCAGIYGPIGKTPQVSMEKFAQALHVNFLGTVYMCHAFIHYLNAPSRKKIVNYSGGGAASPFPNYSAYATSKAAIVRFTENLSIELEGFDVNCVSPGFVITRLHQQTIESGQEKVPQSFLEQTKKQIESGGVPPEKAADLTAFLLSSQSDGISGKFIAVPWDPWQDVEFQNKLRDDKDFATLRRIDDKYFKKV